uniref:Avidin n=1 Tax=Oncorhynchus tshawytscha TaxID=74940 RepID=A0A8C8BUE7_ONCTS
MYSSKRFVGRDGRRRCTQCYHTTFLSDSVVVCTKHPEEESYIGIKMGDLKAEYHRQQLMATVGDQPPTAEAIPCNVTGVWRNELGSLLDIEAVGSELRGRYQSAVETAPGVTGSEQQAKLLGVTSNRGLQTSVAFSVLWEAGSCSSWVGQCFQLPDGKRVLKTLWMLRSVASCPADNWKSTRMGEDTFVFIS